MTKDESKIIGMKNALMGGLQEFNPRPHVSDTNADWFEVINAHGRFEITVKLIESWCVSCKLSDDKHKMDCPHNYKKGLTLR